MNEDIELLRDLDGKLNCHECVFNHEDYYCQLTRVGFKYYSIWLGTNYLEIEVPKKECEFVELKLKGKTLAPKRIDAEKIINMIVKDML